jgi:class 3 adenylate cyclase
MGSRRVRRVARAAAPALLLVVWVVCAGLHVKQVATGRLAWVSVYVVPPTADGDFPIVRGFWPDAAPDTGGALAVGDHLSAVGGADLRGVGPFGFVARTLEVAAASGSLHVPITYRRGGASYETTVALVPVRYPWRMLPLAATLALTAALVLVQRRGTPIAHAFFLAAIAIGAHWMFFLGGPRWQTYAWVAVFSCASLVMLPLVLRAVLIFPAEVAPASGRLPWWPWLFALFGPLSLSWVFGVPLPPETGVRGGLVVNVVFIATLLAVLTRNFRRAGPLGRRQLKWVVLGMYLGLAPVLLADVLAAIEPSLSWLHEAAAIAEIAVPLSILLAIVRTNLFDVDRLITGTVVYSVLSILVLAAALLAVPHLAAALSASSGLDSNIVRPVLSVAAASAMVPGQRALRPRVERLLFRERHALRAGVETLLRELAEATGPEQLLGLLRDRLDTLVRPRSCVIYASLGESFVPVAFSGQAEGRAEPASLRATGAVIGALRARTAPLDVERWAHRLAPGVRAALDTLGAAVLVPVRRGGELAAVVCLGGKRSGDVYTATDLALLAAVGDKVSGELMRFEERAMREALRRYVPEPVAARLTRGQAIEGGERDVSVLFVDIRGYTTYSERRAAGAVFSMVNRYTEAVSAVIQRRGGTVVEFLGDGLMAVFGAPEPMPDHARAAVEAACEIAAAVRGLAPVPEPITVGVGVASGSAFVGNVRTNDRLVYTAVGDVVNLASRIERLTRDLEAAVAIDAVTHRRAGEWAARFQRHERVAIRGRAEPVDVYALPLAAA